MLAPSISRKQDGHFLPQGCIGLGGSQAAREFAYAAREQSGAQTRIIDLDPLSAECTVVNVLEAEMVDPEFGVDLCELDVWRAAMALPLHPEEEVIGCMAGPRGAPMGLIVVPQDFMSLEFHSSQGRCTLIRFDEPSVAESYDPLTRRVAWRGSSSGKITVQCIDDSKPLLVVPGKRRFS